MLLRRNFLSGNACGFGALAVAGIAAQLGVGGRVLHAAASSGGLHHAAKAKRIIFLFMQGGVSQVDSFDYKPLLEKRDGEMAAFDDAREFANRGALGTQQRIMKSPWKFKQYGDSGRYVSELFPNMAKHVDRMAFIHSMHTEGVAHGPATLFMHCGSQNTIRPSMGSWVHFGLGTENENLPGFISIAPSIGNGGARNYGSAFLPSKFQGTPIGKAGADELTLEHVRASGQHTGVFAGGREPIDQLSELNRLQMGNLGSSIDSRTVGELDAAIGSFDLAWRIQSTAPDLFEFKNEDEATRRLYGLDQKETASFGQKCLLARRLCESGVRFVQVNYGDNSANPAWDQHSNLPKHADHARAVDLPIDGLLTDLERRGLLEDTIVWWCGEFGRSPYAEKNGTGRDHNPGGFTTWLAGGGIKPGIAYGETDEFGHMAVRDKVHMHDLHATMLHLMGVDHERLTYQYAGRSFRLTDVHGRIVKPIIA